MQLQLAARADELEALGPAGDDAVERELGRFAAIMRAVELRAVDELAGVVNLHGVRRLRLRAAARLDDLVMQTGLGALYRRILLQLLEVGSGLALRLLRRLGESRLLTAAEHALDLGPKLLRVELALLAAEGRLESLEHRGLLGLGHPELGEIETLSDKVAERLEHLLIGVLRGGGGLGGGRGRGVLLGGDVDERHGAGGDDGGGLQDADEFHLGRVGDGFMTTNRKSRRPDRGPTLRGPASRWQTHTFPRTGPLASRA